MPNLVVYDTETTTNMSGPEKDFNQVIQIASIVYDQDLNKKDSFNFSLSNASIFLFVSNAPGENNDHGNGEHEKLNESFLFKS